MRLRIITLALAILLLAALPAAASEIPVEEAPLPGGFLTYEVNRGADGLLYVTDLYGGNIWRINPATGAYDGFWVPGMPQDARADSSGNIWYTDWSSPTIGRISGGAQPKLTTWDLSLWQNRTYSLAGTAIDPNGRVWFSEYDSTSPGTRTSSSSVSRPTRPSPTRVSSALIRCPGPAITATMWWLRAASSGWATGCRAASSSSTPAPRISGRRIGTRPMWASRAGWPSTRATTSGGPTSSARRFGAST